MEMIQNFIQQKEDEDSEGQIEAYIQEQGQANSERMQKLTANTMKQGLDMQSANGNYILDKLIFKKKKY